MRRMKIMTEQTESPIISAPLSVIEAQERAGIDIQIRTAKQYPRDMVKFADEAMVLATANEEVAGTCFYALPRDSKTIEGPSVRLAEIVMSCWGNCHAGARVIEVGAKTLRSQAVFRDLERNTAVTFEVERRITYSGGGRYSDDMITVTGNAANKIAYRNAVFTGIPQTYWFAIYKAAREASIGKATTIEQMVTKMIKYFTLMGKREEDILLLLELSHTDEITKDHIIRLRGIGNAIKEGEVSVDEAFGKQAAAPDAPRTRAREEEASQMFKGEGTSEPANISDRPVAKKKKKKKKGGGSPEPAPNSKPRPKDTKTAAEKPEPAAKEEPAPEPDPKKIEKISPNTYWTIKEKAMMSGYSPAELTGIITEKYGMKLDKINVDQAAELMAIISKKNVKKKEKGH